VHISLVFLLQHLQGPWCFLHVCCVPDLPVAEHLCACLPSLSSVLHLFAHGIGDMQLSNAVLLRLQRHTDHHMHGSRPYWMLNSLEGAPKLPGSYSAMLLLALVPPLWFCVMNPRVHMHRLLADVQQASDEATDVDASVASG
jgi:hypothetical protein